MASCGSLLDQSHVEDHVWLLTLYVVIGDLTVEGEGGGGGGGRNVGRWLEKD